MIDFPVEVSGRGHIATRDHVLALQDVVSGLPQAAGARTDHFLHGGVYLRRVVIPAGVLVVGKAHLTDHFFICFSGNAVVAGQGENYMMGPGDSVISPVGTKRVVYAITDFICATIHATDAADIAGLEDTMFEHDDGARYDFNNQPIGRDS